MSPTIGSHQKGPGPHFLGVHACSEILGNVLKFPLNDWFLEEQQVREPWLSQRDCGAFSGNYDGLSLWP